MIAFARICGQNPATSPSFFGEQSPLCYRCLGIYLTLACGLVLARRAAPTSQAFLLRLGLAVGALALLGFDALVFQRWLPNNATRLLTGVLAGWSLALVLTESVRVLWTKDPITHSLKGGT